MPSELDNPAADTTEIVLTDEQIAVQNFIKLIQQNPGVRLAVEKALALTKVEGKSKTSIAVSNGVYYKRPYGEEMKKFVDDMIARGVPKIFYLRNAKYTINSLMCRIDQSLRYLINELDPQMKYVLFRKEVTIVRIKDPQNPNQYIGAAIKWNHQLLEEHGGLDVGDLGQDDVTILNAKTPINKWKLLLTDWLEVPWSEALDKKDCKLDIAGLALTELEITEIELLIKDLTEVTGKIEKHRIFLIKSKG